MFKWLWLQTLIWLQGRIRICDLEHTYSQNFYEWMMRYHQNFYESSIRNDFGIDFGYYHCNSLTKHPSSCHTLHKSIASFCMKILHNRILLECFRLQCFLQLRFLLVLSRLHIRNSICFFVTKLHIHLSSQSYPGKLLHCLHTRMEVAASCFHNSFLPIG